MTVLETGNPLGNLEPFNDAWPGETGVGLFDDDSTIFAC